MNKISKRVCSYLQRAKALCANRKGGAGLVEMGLLILIIVVICVVVFFPQVTELMSNMFEGVKGQIEVITNYKG